MRQPPMRTRTFTIALAAALMSGSAALAQAAQTTPDETTPAQATPAPVDHSAHAADHANHAALQAALASPLRSEANRARDQYRHPMETLAFFGVDPTDTVVELWPGGGWYTEVLSPYLADAGHLWVAASNTAGIEKKIASDPSYAKVKVASVKDGQPSAIPAGSADVVLTFRNVHNWLGSENNAPIADAVFAEAFRMLKPGGTLGVVEHRLPEDTDAAREKGSGYVKTSTVKAVAEKAGFRFVEASEINANPKDTADYPGGVWTLPPSLQLKDVDRDKYMAIGARDRMTLKFVKPE